MAWERYDDIGNDSSIIEYDMHFNGISITFANKATHSGKTANVYKYTNNSAGEETIKTMKSLAVKGNNLNKFINENKPGYSERWLR